MTGRTQCVAEYELRVRNTYDVPAGIDREFEFYEFSFLKFNEFYEFFSVEKIRKNS